MTVLYLTVLLALAIMAISRPRFRHALTLWVLFFPCLRLLQFALLMMAGTRSVRYDQWLYLADRWFGSPSWALGRFLLAFPWLRSLVIVDYNYCAEAVMVSILILAIFRTPSEAWRAFASVLAAGAVAPLAYKILPASGPAYAFSGFPYHQPVMVAPHTLMLSAAPNCMPSMHLVSGLMVVYFLRHWRLGRILAGIHLAMTVLATLGLGEHYVIDLVAAVPYAYGFLWLSVQHRREVQQNPSSARGALGSAVSDGIAI